MALDTRKYGKKHTDLLRDTRPWLVRVGEWMRKPSNSTAIFTMAAGGIYFSPGFAAAGDLVMVGALLYYWWLKKSDRAIAFKLPMGSKYPDANNKGPGRSGKGEGILYLGNMEKTNEEVWFTNSDARTHVLYLGTTGSGKTEGLKSMVTNALSWGSGFVYVDGKADTDLWSSLSSLVRRFGRDDDLLVLNYMTGNSDSRAPSNTMNPFSSGSASYLTNMLVSLMPEAEGDNAMWKERAVSLVGSLMPALTWKRAHQEMPLSVSTIREYLNLNNIIRLSRDQALPEKLRSSIRGYLDTLPGYVDAAFDDTGREKPAGPDQPMIDTTTARQQHGYLAMQFTRSLQSLGDDYGYIFDSQAADVEMVDVVLNRRILVVLIPALEKSADETANLGKIVAATLKGMMGSTLGSTVEGESATVIENKPTHSSTPFMVVFDEVGYYTAAGMAVMAAQARSLGFCLIYSAQDLPALEKRVKEEARSITANCNIKIFGKLEDPTQTKEFFEKTVGSELVMEASGFQLSGDRTVGSYYDNKQAGLQIRSKASYDGLKAFKEGQAVISFGTGVIDTAIFYSNPGHAKAMRVTRFMALPPTDEALLANAPSITKLRDLMVHKTWTALKADVNTKTPKEITAMHTTYEAALPVLGTGVTAGMAAVASIAVMNGDASVTAAGSSSVGPAERIQAEATAQITNQPAATMPPLTATRPAEAVVQQPGFNPMQQILKKSKGEEETSAAPATPAVQERPAQTQAQAPAQSGAGPMGFFAKAPGGTAAPEQAPTAPAQQQPVQAPAAQAPVERPLSWDELVDAAGDGTALPGAQSPQQAAQNQSAPNQSAQNQSALDAETQDILKKAGEAARKNLIKGKDDGDAAE
ncbi:TraM recognition domain-containing protein [Micavibrio aeruginosavorus]|uniref:type IV secretory system conjugative DNA transfer family protein n=1 Tax=Micavibrio aeruginosavorus TaxID=349221 RepID=UPI003F4A861E